MGVAQRRGGWERLAGLRLDEARLALAEGCEGAVEPGVAEERSGLTVLRREKHRRRPVRAGRDYLQRPSLGPRQALLRRRELLEQPPQGRAQERQLRNVFCRMRHERRGVGAAQRIPGRCCCGEGAGCRRDACGPQRLKLLRGQLAEPAE